MKALVFRGPGNVNLEECQIPVIGSDELLVRVKAAGVCGTDVRIYRGTKKIDAPRIIGHEFSGDVAEVGSEVSGYSVGDRITCYPSITCGACYACRGGRSNICVNRTTIGYEIDGGFAEYVRIPAAALKNGNVSTLPVNISFEEAAASEPLTAAYNGIKRAGVRSGSKVLIVGAGPIGLLHTQLAKLYGAGLVVVSEPQQDKQELAMNLGADAIIDPFTENVQEQVGELTDGVGMDIVIVDVGLPKVIEESVELLKKGGTFVIFAGCPVGSKITLDPNRIHYKELIITGSSASTPDDQREMLQLVAAGKINLNAVISAVLPVNMWQVAFEMKANYEGLKTLLAF